MRRTRILVLAGLVLLVTLSIALTTNGCAGTGPEDLPEDEAEIRVLDPEPVAKESPRPIPPPKSNPTPPSAPQGAPAAAPPSQPVEEAASPPPVVEPLPPPGPFRRLALGKVRGGQLAFEVAGTPEEVAAMFVDYDAANGHRSWAQTYRVVSREKGRVVAEWHFRGKMGVSPVVQLEFKTKPKKDGYRIRYKLVKKAFGIASFFGDYVVEPVSTEPPRSRITERVFIDSGLPFVNADHQDLEDGLREDARLIRAWMNSRARPGR